MSLTNIVQMYKVALKDHVLPQNCIQHCTQSLYTHKTAYNNIVHLYKVMHKAFMLEKVGYEVLNL